MRDLWRRSHSLQPLQAPAVWLLTAATGAALAYLGSAYSWPVHPATLGAGTLALATGFAALGWPDWLSQGLRRLQHDDPPADDITARARLLTATCLFLAVAVGSLFLL